MATALEATVQDISVKGTFDHATNVHETIVHETIDTVEFVQEAISDTLKGNKKQSIFAEPYPYCLRYSYLQCPKIWQHSEDIMNS